MMGLEQRFKSHFSKTNSCWKWISGKTRFGYGALRNEEGKMEAAHRISYRLYNGKIPRDKIVMHTCDNPECVNPKHLKLGTHRSSSFASLTAVDNTQDMLKKGRGGHHKKNFKGNNNPNSKLSDDDIDFIIHMTLGRQIKQKDLAIMFGVHRTTIKRVMDDYGDYN